LFSELTAENALATLAASVVTGLTPPLPFPTKDRHIVDKAVHPAAEAGSA
jgi:hypothetical protein